jgi:hypothetical protein
MKKKHSKLTAENLRTLADPLEDGNAENDEDTIRIEETGKMWLKTNLKIDADKIFSNGRMRRSDILIRQQSDGKDNLSNSEVLSKTSSNLLYESASQNAFRLGEKISQNNYHLRFI